MSKTGCASGALSHSYGGSMKWGNHAEPIRQCAADTTRGNEETEGENCVEKGTDKRVKNTAFLFHSQVISD